MLIIIWEAEKESNFIFFRGEVAMLTASELMKVLEEDMLLCPKSTGDCCSAIAT